MSPYRCRVNHNSVIYGLGQLRPVLRLEPITQLEGRVRENAQDQHDGSPTDPAEQRTDQTRLHRLLAARALQSRPGGEQLFAYAGRQLSNGSWLSEDDYIAFALGAGGLMLTHDHAAVAARLRARGYRLPLVLDPACYFRNAADDAQLSLLHPEPESRWVAVQCEQQVAMYLSRAPFVPAGDMAGLDAALESGRRFCDLAGSQPHKAPAMIALPIHYQWLTTNHLGALCAALTQADTSVALLPGGQSDPLASRQAVRGLVELLSDSPQPIAVLRTDLAGLGALAYGAVATAIGVSASQRHTTEPGKRGFTQPDRTARVLVEPLLSWVRGSVLERIARDDGMLNCDCAVCYGRSLRRFGNPHPELLREAAAHSVLVWRAVADRVLSGPAGGRAAAWLQACEDAREMHARLRAQSRVDVWEPDYLSSWTALR
jgi:hypothetical protein